MLLVLAWTVGVGAYTVVARWHRLSDTVGADAIAVLMASLGGLVLLRSGLVRPVPESSRAPVRTVFVVLASLYAVGMGAVGVYLGVVGAGQDPGSTADFNLYLAAQSLASVGSVLAVLAFWASWHRLETASTATGSG